MKNKLSLMEELQKKLETNFDNIRLLEIATTHSSYANQKKNVVYNERLEFLGDSVLQLCITEYLFSNYTDKTEGELTKIRSLIVCEQSLFSIAKKWNLGNYISMSKGEEITGGRHRVSIQADCVEAIIAAIYLDRGLDTAKKFIFKNFEGIIKKAINNEIVFDYKTKLQETMQKNSDSNIEYKLVNFEGPPHRRQFYVSLYINNKLVGKGIGFSKKESEQNAAKEALDRMEDIFE